MFKKGSSGRRAALTLGTWVAYAIAFALLYRLVGPTVAALAVLPVCVAGWLFGVRVGLLAGLLAFPVNLLLMFLVMGSGWDIISPANLFGSIVIALVGAMFGRLRDMSERVKRELAERKQVEEALQHRVEMEELVATISTRFVKAAPAEVENEINRALQAVGTIAGVDRSYVFQFSDDGTTMDNTYEWCAEGIEPQMGDLQGLPTEGFSWWMGKLRRFETVHIPRVADLPPEASAEKGLLQAQDILSLISVPLVHAQSLVGFWGFDTVRTEKTWNQEDIALLNLVGEILVSTLEHKRTEVEIKRVADDLTRLIETANAPIFGIDAQGKVNEWNQTAARITGFSKGAVLGHDLVEEFITEEYRTSVKKVLDNALAGKETANFEFPLYSKEGQRVMVLLNATTRRDAQGNVVGVVGVGQDITKRKRAEEALQQRTHDLNERVKELNCLYGVSELIDKPGASLEEILQGTANLLPLGWQYPEITAARVILEEREFRTKDFVEGDCQQSSDIVVRGKRAGAVEVYYLEERPECDEGPFLKEERSLIDVIAERLGETIERLQAQKALEEYSERLEDMVEERTRELREAQAQLLAQQRLQRDLELAAQVQASLLPRHVPALHGFDFAATALPARYVSGDLYDFILPDSETCHIVLADIAGKGVPAALLTSTARALVRGQAEREDSPAAILSNVNALLYEDLGQAETFITFFAARLDARLGTLTYANAGHTETLWWQQASRACRHLPATGLPMGIYADEPILEESFALHPGDALVFYSDSITEAANSRDELFGLERLIATVSDHAHLSASDLAQTIVEAVEAFRADAPRSDDLTLIVLKALPRTLSFTYPATLDHLDEVTLLVQQAASAYGDAVAYQMELATSEIVTNIIEHAYRRSSGDMRGQISLLPDQIQVDLYDDGAPFDLSQVPELDLTKLQDRGRGLFIVRQLTDELIYDPATPEGNHWRLVKLAEGGQAK